MLLVHSKCSVSAVQLLSRVRLFVTPRTVSWTLPKFMSIESVMPSNHFILCYPLLLLPSISDRYYIFLQKNIHGYCLITGLLQSYIFRKQQIKVRRRQWQPTPVLLPGKFHGWRSLVGCSPRGREESDTTERLDFHFSLSCMGEGNGNPLQCSCLENPRDRGAWGAAVYGITQSRTRLKRLSSSSSRLCISGNFTRKKRWTGYQKLIKYCSTNYEFQVKHL